MSGTGAAPMGRNEENFKALHALTTGTFADHEEGDDDDLLSPPYNSGNEDSGPIIWAYAAV